MRATSLGSWRCSPDNVQTTMSAPPDQLIQEGARDKATNVHLADALDVWEHTCHLRGHRPIESHIGLFGGASGRRSASALALRHTRPHRSGHASTSMAPPFTCAHPKTRRLRFPKPRPQEANISYLGCRPQWKPMPVCGISCLGRIPARNQQD